jgi:hypothetical protein
MDMGFVSVPASRSGVVARDSDCGSTFQTAYLSEDVELDTDFQSRFWQSAPSIDAELDTHGCFTHRYGRYGTQVRSRWTPTSLYLLFTCPYEEICLNPVPVTDKETFGLSNWDVAELFIGSDFHNIRRYKEFAVSLQGEWVDLDIDLDLPDHTVGWQWSSGCEVSARIDRLESVWYGAMRIPFRAIDHRPPVAGRRFRANLFRSQGSPERQWLIAWRAPMQDNFHVPEKFGHLTMVHIG